MSEILFGQSYYVRFDPKLWQAQQPYAPLGTLYAAAYLREHGYAVALFDAMIATSEAEWAAALEREAPRFAVLYEDNFNYLSKMCLLRMREAGLSMAATAHARGCTTIVSGSDATDHPEQYLDAGADFVLIGEGEVTLRELLDALSGRSGAPLDRIAGLCFRSADGRVVRTAARPLIRDLDTLPFPARDLVDIDRYRRTWTTRHGTFSMNLVTTRGCPYHCNWCAKPIYGQRYTVRSPANVVAEMAWLQRTYRPDHLWFADDLFGLKPGWTEQFADLVVREGCAIPFKCLLRADLVDEETAAALARARCRTVWIGAESGSQRILDAMEKGTKVEQIARATRLLRNAGIAVGFFLQFGYPGETRADIDKTLTMVRECQPDDIGISVSYPLPGTKFYERVVAQLGGKRNWTDSNDLAMMYRGTYSTDFYRKLYAVVHKEFRIRKARQALGSGRGAWRLGREGMREAAALVYHSATLPVERLHLRRLGRSPHQGLPPLEPGMPQPLAARPSDPR
jgi:anaerobic magnesium-protoporphyrin IX monomethyl ester cyclase